MTIKNAYAWLVQLVSGFKNSTNDLKLLAEAQDNQDTVDCNIKDVKSYYEAPCHNASELFGDIADNIFFAKHV
jgi:hypothetical protein